MTKDEMLKEYFYEKNYDMVQSRIKEKMKKGERSICFGKEDYKNFKPDWIMLDDTKHRLEDDGFEIEECNYDEWMIRW